MFARRKGRSGEQEAVRLLRECFGDLWSFERNSFQSRMGGDDVATDAPYSWEIKRAEKPLWSQWFAQAKDQGARHTPPKMPVVMHRANNQEWTFTMQMNGREFARVVRALDLFNHLPQETQLALLGGKGPPIKAPQLPGRNDATE